MRRYSQYSSIDDATVAKIEKICPDIRLRSVNTSLWTWRKEPNHPKGPPLRERNKAMIDALDAAVKLRAAMAKIDGYTLESELLRRTLGRGAYGRLPDHLDKLAALAASLAERQDRDHRKDLSTLSTLIVDVGYAVMGAGGVVDARSTGQVVRIVGTLAESIGRADPDRTTVRDALKFVEPAGLNRWQAWEYLLGG
ncbi:hypothetical protein [Sphingosinicella microcystinivorans]|uniref:hypothetical protein n=1 Tax=Sphingosinicella microcystinivorans TaxID=335406 RepID=UPI0022F3C20C|nr:hypothetical protein [Sphingosinicella microcystinivorans]WBX83016.1 hypothetical protein PE061_14510 [Sphingosinicella microcystinivorans]